MDEWKNTVRILRNMASDQLSEKSTNRKGFIYNIRAIANDLDKILEEDKNARTR